MINTYQVGNQTVKAQMAHFEGSNGKQHATESGWATIRGTFIWAEVNDTQYESGEIEFPDFNSQIDVDYAVNMIRNASVSRNAWIEVGGRKISR